MKRSAFICLLSLLLTLRSTGQEKEQMRGIGLTAISQVNQGNSYITFPTDIGNLQPLWFEGNIIPNFYIRESKNSRLIGVLTPQIVIRMFREESFPVWTPGYMPQISIYYLIKGKADANQLSLYGRIGHHSNGQDADFYLSTGDINLKSGNFSTNFLELGIIATNGNSHRNAYQFFKSSVEYHPDAWTLQELDGLYSKFRWHNAVSIFRLPFKDSGKARKNADISLKGEATWMFGELNKTESYAFDRLNLRLTFYYHPEFLEDIGLFVQFYHGSDYYNIYFNHRLDVLRFGLMTEKLRF